MSMLLGGPSSLGKSTKHFNILPRPGEKRIAHWRVLGGKVCWRLARAISNDKLVLCSMLT